MNTDNFSIFTINYQKTIREAFKKLSLNKRQFVIVIDDDNKVVGVVTDGDFRRAIWNTVSLEEPINTIANRKFVFFSEQYDMSEIKRIFSTTDVRHIPILKNQKLVDLIFKEDFVSSKLEISKARLDMPVVIMAGGFGTRLDPFTRILPKSLIPVGEKAVIEIIIDKFAEYGASWFYISVNHKAKMVKAFFEDFTLKHNISYIDEEIPLGTAGALKFLEDKIQSPFIVTNCDVIIEEDYTKIVKFHREGEYLFTLVGSMQHHVIPYGVCRIKNGGELDDLKEKPEYDFLVNTGMYILNPDVLKFIPHNKKFDITDLINELTRHKEKIGVYPISEKSWIDIGQWEKYKKALDRLL